MGPSESSPLLHTPTSVSQRHRLAPPSIRFPGHATQERQNSYGFPNEGMSESSTSDRTLVNSPKDQLDYTTGSATKSHRLKPTREDSKIYTSFPSPVGTPWRESGTPTDQQQYPFFSRLFGTKSSNDRHEYSNIYDEEAGHPDRLPGLPKLSRECLIAEIKCYGKYILPTVLVFVVLVLIIALSLFYHYKD
ncbi:hypothetical protein P389DRAFT_164702 [Cystobasidium minutum MCA 4210]|uniref:uncharacterized protein n=1 Tax=Cystobasidium minutum MCA 4210 TaxID=1397322 RepID=UPI0034CFC8EC|eukprot:jgi/Rhomi1/164702/fgenesh1_kg.1_\